MSCSLAYGAEISIQSCDLHGCSRKLTRSSSSATATVTDDGGRRTLGETGHATVTDTATMIGEVMAGDVSGKTNDGETVMIETEILEEQVPRAVRPLLVHAPSNRKSHPHGRAHVLRLLKTRRSRTSRRPDCSRQLRRRSSLATAQRQS